MSVLEALFGGALVLVLAGVPAGAAEGQAQAPPADPWNALRFLAGEWRGTAEGKSGSGGVYRSYEFMLGERYLEEWNVTTYHAQEKNPEGERHEHRSVLSYDRGRKAFVLRQFHQEGFVNQYVMDPTKSSPARLVFDSEAIENLDSRWRARETYEIVSPDELVEVFELAAPGKSFETYSRTQLTRMKGMKGTAVIGVAQGTVPAPALAKIVVRVLDEKATPLPGATVELSPTDCDRRPLRSETDTFGRVVFEDMVGGHYVLVARFPDYAAGRQQLDTRTCPAGVCEAVLQVVPELVEYDPEFWKR